jgi:acetyltransferase-like isoleucine patch superfamily enzyme
MKLLVLNLYWALTRFYLRCRGAKVGKNVKCNGYPFVKVCKGGSLVIEDDVQINSARWANAHIVAGSMNLFVAAGATLRLGRGVGVSGTRIVAMHSIEIGSDTLIGAGCLICDSDMHEIPLGNPKGTSTGRITIGKRVFVAANCTLLKGVAIGDGAVIGANSCISKSVSSHALTAGNPAKEIHRFPNFS